MSKIGALANSILCDYGDALDILTEQGEIIDSNPLVPFVTKNQIELSWGKSAGLSYLFATESNLEHYRLIIENRDFCMCLSNGALIQIHYAIEEENIARHRLCYFPCPFTFTREEVQDFSICEFVDCISADEIRSRFVMKSPIRFDFDANNSDEKHHHSHVTINSNSCRIPAYGPIGLGNFMRFVIRYFHETVFDSASKAWLEINPQYYTRTIGYPVSHEMYFDTTHR